MLFAWSFREGCKAEPGSHINLLFSLSITVPASSAYRVKGSALSWSSSNRAFPDATSALSGVRVFLEGKRISTI